MMFELDFVREKDQESNGGKERLEREREIGERGREESFEKVL